MLIGFLEFGSTAIATFIFLFYIDNHMMNPKIITTLPEILKLIMYNWTSLLFNQVYYQILSFNILTLQLIWVTADEDCILFI